MFKILILAYLIGQDPVALQTFRLGWGMTDFVPGEGPRSA